VTQECGLQDSTAQHMRSQVHDEHLCAEPNQQLGLLCHCRPSVLSKGQDKHTTNTQEQLVVASIVTASIASIWENNSRTTTTAWPPSLKTAPMMPAHLQSTDVIIIKYASSPAVH
jgi:hypothetical protein